MCNYARVNAQPPHLVSVGAQKKRFAVFNVGVLALPFLITLCADLVILSGDAEKGAGIEKKWLSRVGVEVFVGEA